MANEIRNVSNEMFDAMNDWFKSSKNFFDENGITNLMRSDITENDKEYIVTIDMPGLKKDKINLNYNNGVLSVSANRESVKTKSDAKNNIIHQERSEGHISRSFRLPNVVAKQIHAKYDDGVLTVTLPKQTAGDNDSSIQID